MKKITSLIPLSIIFPIFIFLGGCIPAAFVAGGATGVVAYDQRPVKTINRDHSIAHQAQLRVDDDLDLRRNAHIAISVFNGVVLMVGQAPTEEQRSRAYQIVEKVPGVKRIYNEVSIAGPSSALSRTNDGWITSKIKTAMLAQPGLRSGQIKVVTENSTVYLMGLVSRKQADLAAQVARAVPGVQKVVKIFEYT